MDTSSSLKNSFSYKLKTYIIHTIHVRNSMHIIVKKVKWILLLLCFSPYFFAFKLLLLELFWFQIATSFTSNLLMHIYCYFSHSLDFLAF